VRFTCYDGNSETIFVPLLSDTVRH